MKNSILSLFLICFAVIASTAQQTATVYVARKGLYSGAKKNIAIYMDKDLVSEISNGKYVALTVSPGEHKFYGQWYATEGKGEEAITLTIEPGKEYYLRAGKEARGLKEVVTLEEITVSTWNKLKPDLEELKKK